MEEELSEPSEPLLPQSVCVKITQGGGFPGGAVVENLPANAGDKGSSPGLGRSHMPQSNWALEPQLLSLRVWSLCSATREAAAVRGPRTTMKSGPRLPQLEKALAQKRRPNTAINKLKKKKNYLGCLGPSPDLPILNLSAQQQHFWQILHLIPMHSKFEIIGLDHSVVSFNW